MKKLFITALAMLCMSIGTWADTEVSSATELTTALSSAPTDGTETVITLTGDITGTDTDSDNKDFTIPTGAKITLNLNNHNITGSGSGTIFYNEGTLTINGDGVISGGKGITYDGNVSGGAIFNNGTLTITGGTFKDNVFEGLGAVVCSANNSTLSISGGTFSNNKAQIGGVIFTHAGTNFTISGGTFTGNSATGGGGVINTYQTDAITITNGTFSNNTADYGGVIYGSVVIEDGIFSNNTVEGGGGVAYVERETVTIKGGTFSQNSADIHGGVVWAKTAIVSGGEFVKNTAASFAGAVLGTGSCTISNATFKENTAAYGGAAMSPVTCTVNSGEFINNSATTAGGALATMGTITVSGGTFDGNASAAGAIGAVLDGDDGSVTSEYVTINNASVVLKNLKLHSGYQLDGVTLTTTPTCAPAAQVVDKDENRYYVEETTNAIFIDGESYTGTELSNKNATYSRTVSNNYGTIVLPFKPTTVTDGVTFYTVSNLNGSNLSIEEVALDDVVANKPYIFKANAAGTLTFSAENTTVYAAPSEAPTNETSCGVTIIGSYTEMGSSGNVATDQTNYDYYYINGDKFWKATGTLEVNAYRAYLRVAKTGNNAKSLNIELDGATGIKAVSNEASASGNNNAYNIAGQRVAPTTKGIVVVNGRKIINK